MISLSKAKVYLKVRKGPSFDSEELKYDDLTCDQKLVTLEKTVKKYNGIARGFVVHVDEIKDNWGRINDGWICLDYCQKKTT